MAQAAHASMAFIGDRMREFGDYRPKNKQQLDWFKGAFTKIVFGVESEEELKALYEHAKKLGIEAYLITDSGRTEFDGVPTVTALGIGPDYIDVIDPVTKELDLL